MQSLLGKKILFISPKFFSYENEIASELKSQGAEVDFLPDRPFNSAVMKAITRYCRNLIIPLSNKYFLHAIDAFSRNDYDLIFVIQGEGLSLEVLSIIRSRYSKASFVLYLWDSLRNKKALVPNLASFDWCYTFDEEDAAKYKIKFRPLFFLPGFSQSCETSSTIKYHLSFIGTAHSDRYRIVANIIAAIPASLKCYWYLYLQAPWVFWVHKLINPAYKNAQRSSFSFTPIPRKDLQDIFFESVAILDIEHPLQVGLTMRTFEAMGASKKLITTNQRVKNMDFYNSKNIMVIDRNNIPNIPLEFFESPYEHLADEIYYKYSLNGWLNDVIIPGVVSASINGGDH